LKEYQFYENAALKIYENKGYRLIKRNHTGRGFEIDLIFQKANSLKVVEVKASVFESDIIAEKFRSKQFRFYRRFLSKIENSHLSTYNLSFDLIVFAKSPYKVLKFIIYKIIE
tara:strand:- start:5596 stop:5934 length:339 start_codon:yes stop_codon:yes gene_type:complete